MSIRSRRRTRKAIRHDLLCDDPHCMWCGLWFDSIPVYSSDKYMPTIEHILPRAQGGSDEWSNLGLACWDCNQLGHVNRNK